MEDKATHNCEIYMSDLIDGKGYGHSDMESLFVLPQEQIDFLNVANRTKKQICMDINLKISELKEIGDLHEAILFREALDRVGKSLLIDHIELFEEVAGVVDSLHDIMQ